MKAEINNLIIIGAASPLLIYGYYKYFKSSSELNETYCEIPLNTNNVDISVNENTSISKDLQDTNTILESRSPIQINDFSFNNCVEDNSIVSPALSKKNSVISSRTSSIVDLCDLDHSNNNNENQNLKHFDEDAHFVESDDNYISNKRKGYFSFVKKFFGS